MYERFTDRARKVFQLAQQEAQRFNHEYIGTEHILLGLIKEGGGVAAAVLKNLDLDLRKIRLEVEKKVQSGPDMFTMGKLPQTPRAKRVVEESMKAARERNHNYVGTEHVLIGLLREKDGIGFQVLNELGLTEEALQDVDTLLGVDRAQLEAIEINALQQAVARAIANHDFEEAADLRDALDKLKKSTSKRHKEALIGIANALFVYVVDVDSKKALESIRQIAVDGLTGT